jgi:hypothetical protein
MLGAEEETTVNFSILNWAILEMLPNTQNSKASRTMPVIFSLRVAAAVNRKEKIKLTFDHVLDEKLQEIVDEHFNQKSISYKNV